MAPEMVHDLFMAAYKADPILEPKRNVTREAYAVRRIMEELLDNPQLQQLQEMTAGDATLSTIATDSMKTSVMEIITRIPPPPPPPSEGGKGGGKGNPQGGGGQQQGDGEGEESEEEQAHGAAEDRGSGRKSGGPAGSGPFAFLLRNRAVDAREEVKAHGEQRQERRAGRAR